MAFLEKFSVEERALLVRLPYRAGVWISQADETGNPGADNDERAALEKIIAGQVRGMFHSAFAHEVMAEMWGARAEWGTWEGNMAAFLGQCAEAARIINLKLARHELDAYRATIMHIATEVAKAFREMGVGQEKTFKSRMHRHWALWSGRFITLVRNEPYDPMAILNISVLEDRALTVLAEALSAGAEHAVING